MEQLVARKKNVLRKLACSAVVGCAILATRTPARAQVAHQDAATGPLAVDVTAEDFAAARGIADLRYHITRANTPAAQSAPLDGPSEPQVGPEVPPSELPAPSVSVPLLSPPGFYPADLSYFGGHTISVAQSHAIYLGCSTPTCWGNPEKFLTDLGNSTFIHIADQYVGVTANGRYTVGKSFTVSGTFPHVLGLNSDLAPILHAAAKVSGTGYANIYHFFIPKGIDICSDDPNNTHCYSPDQPSTFAFCGFHGNGTFPDIGHVVFTVEPYQNIPHCAVQTPSPNGQLADSTNSLLSHEVFETITDPDDESWFAVKSLSEHGYEVGDVCQPYVNNSQFFLVPTFLINGKPYEVQLEYSNRYHGCTNIP
jgi:hypothetical protein